MAIQYSKWLLGQDYDSTPGTHLSMAAEEEIPIGTPVMAGTNHERQVKKFNGGFTTTMLGVAGLSKMVMHDGTTTARPQGAYLPGQMVTVKYKGTIVIPLYGTQTVVEGDIAYLDVSYDRITNQYVDNYTSVAIGKFRSSGHTETYNTMLFVLDLIPNYQAYPADKIRDLDVKKTSEDSNSKSNLNTKIKREKK